MKTYKLSDIAPFLKEGDEFCAHTWEGRPSGEWHCGRPTEDQLSYFGEEQVSYRPAGSTSEEGELCEAYEESLREKTEEPFDPKDLSKLKKGDVIVNEEGNFCLILARLEDLVFRSTAWCKSLDPLVRARLAETAASFYSIRELERDGWTIYREPDPTETIEIDGKKYLKADIEKLNPINQ